MDQADWQTIELNKQLLCLYVDVQEVIFYLEEALPPDQRQEMREFQQNDIKSLLMYLHFKPNGFTLLCNALEKCQQEFLVKALVATKEAIPCVDGPEIQIPESRAMLFHEITTKLRSGQSFINLKGERGVGTSRFLEQICQFLHDSCYFTIHKIDLTDTPLIMQRKLFVKYRHEIITKESILKRYCVFCIDNVNAALLAQPPEYRTHQEGFVKMCISTCKDTLGISLLTASTQDLDGLETFEVERLSCNEMGRDIQAIFPAINDTELKELVCEFEEKCNPLDCFLATTFYLLHSKKISHLHKHLEKHGRDRNIMFSMVFNKLTRTQQNILFSVYSLPCNAQLTLPSLMSLFDGSTRPPAEEHILDIESELTALTQLNLIRESDGWYSMKDSNFFYHFRAFFEKSYRSKLCQFYVRGLHHYLDYTIKIIQDVNSLSDFTKLQQKEWEDTIPCISLVLNPSDKVLEQDVLKTRNMSSAVYQKRIFSIQKLANIALNISYETLVLTANNLLDEYDTYHVKYADIEDKVQLMCLITDLSLTPTCNTGDVRHNLYRALQEVQVLVERTKSEALRVKYYLRILIPMGEIYFKERNFERAKGCFNECLKLKSGNKTINWMIRKRIKTIRLLTEDQLSSQETVMSPITPPDGNPNSVLSNEIKFHLDMGDSLYVRGEFYKAFDYYFELWRQFYSLHLHLRDQEYILATMGHLKLQKHSKLILSQVHDAIKFYEQSNIFYRKRKECDSPFIRIYLLTANLLANRKSVVKDLLREFINAQADRHDEFFITTIHRDTNHRFMWRDLTITEREFLPNRIKPAMVNYYMLEAHHYTMKLKHFNFLDPSRFLQFPHERAMEHVALFTPQLLYNQKELHVVVYIKIRTTRI